MTLEDEIREWYTAEDDRTVLDAVWEFRLRAGRHTVQQACKGLKSRNSKRNAKKTNTADDKQSNIDARNKAHYATPTARIAHSTQYKRHRW